MQGILAVIGSVGPWGDQNRGSFGIESQVKLHPVIFTGQSENCIHIRVPVHHPLLYESSGIFTFHILVHRGVSDVFQRVPPGPYGSLPKVCIWVHGDAIRAIHVEVTSLFLEEFYGVVIWMGVVIRFVDHLGTVFYCVEMANGLSRIVTVGHNFGSTIAKLQLFFYT
jgi:hypothetical protein